MLLASGTDFESFTKPRKRIFTTISLSPRAILSLLLRGITPEYYSKLSSALRLNNRTEKQEGRLRWKREREDDREREREEKRRGGCGTRRNARENERRCALARATCFN